MWDIFIPSRIPNTKYTLKAACVSSHKQYESRWYRFFLFFCAYRKKNFYAFRLCFTSLISYLIDIYFQLFSINCLQNEQWRPNATSFACIYLVVRERVRTPGIAEMLAIAEKQQFHRKFEFQRNRSWEYRCCFVLCTLSRRRMLRLYYAGSVWYKQISIERDREREKKRRNIDLWQHANDDVLTQSIQA